MFIFGFFYFFFFFFKQKTAYEIRKGDWSSDVCSSDLGRRGLATTAWPTPASPIKRLAIAASPPRSEERRVGKEGPSLCRSRWSPDHLKKKGGVDWGMKDEGIDTQREDGGSER